MIKRFFDFGSEEDFWVFGWFVGFLFMNPAVIIITIMLSYITYYTMFKFVYLWFDRNEKFNK